MVEEASEYVDVWKGPLVLPRDGNPSEKGTRTEGNGEEAGTAWGSVVRIVQSKVDVLLELNGHTMGSGLPLLAGRISPIQATWLGHWQSTGGLDVDYFLADAGSAPGDVMVTSTGRGLTEGLVLLPMPALANDYASAQRHVASERGIPGVCIEDEEGGSMVARAMCLFCGATGQGQGHVQGPGPVVASRSAHSPHGEAGGIEVRDMTVGMHRDQQWRLEKWEALRVILGDNWEG